MASSCPGLELTVRGLVPGCSSRAGSSRALGRKPLPAIRRKLERQLCALAVSDCAWFAFLSLAAVKQLSRFHIPMLCFFSISLPWSACTGLSTRLLGECLQAGAALPAETVPTMPLGADHHENHSLGHLHIICLVPALVIPVSRAMGGSAAWVLSAAASTLLRCYTRENTRFQPWNRSSCS